MPRVNKNKHAINKQVLNMESQYEPPAENQQYARVLDCRGNNVHEVEPAVFELDENSEPIKSFLVSMPSKFRNNIWVKRDSFVIIEMIAEGKKVRGEIVRILMPDHVKELKKLPSWPAKFTTNETTLPRKDKHSGSDEDDLSDSDFNTPYNGNRWTKQDDTDTDESETEDETDNTTKSNN